MQKPVVKASREWICIRLLTYESEAEYEFMEELLGVQKGTLPNTVFCMLAPDGKTRLSRPSRSPSFFRTPENLATQMQRLAAGYKSSVPDSFVAPVPLIHRVDLALNVAASDNRPLIVAYHSNTDGLNTILNSVKHVIWEPEFIGQFMIAATTQPEDLKPLSGGTGEPGLYVIEPDEYGVSGKVTRFVDAQKVEVLAKNMLALGLKSFQPFEKNHQQHIRSGYLFGIEWDTVVPESDPMSVQAKQRYKARFNNRP